MCVCAVFVKTDAEMECQCENNAKAAPAGWFMGGSNVQMGGFAVVGYLLYRFSQTLPVLIRWPIRFFCYITGLSALWGWVSRLVGTFRGIKNLLKWVSRVWRFLVGSSDDGPQISGTSRESDLRLIFLGPNVADRNIIADNLLALGSNKTKPFSNVVKKGIKQSTVLDGREITVINTPDVLGSSMGNASRAREALRSLQLTSPGPHAFLLVIKAQGSGESVGQDLTRAIQGALELFGEGVTGYIIPVISYVDGRQSFTMDELLEGLEKACSICGQSPELVDISGYVPPTGKYSSRRSKDCAYRDLVERVLDVKENRGHFVHEVYKREVELRETLLDDMSSALAQQLGHR
ncbi:PREDICTED: GTPase IMAP family member 4-like isoform X3 [Poecilia mexicana]|uniref:GTPase IMAP family member 4-like isoform X3 n=1 Tax=Poecilia mexicana TaxID=48701 RepID=UPI00072DC06A|nr:PREDICTED: GTPase IMAP family member 4-like isoform X3 [Poecilia mexicana]